MAGTSPAMTTKRRPCSLRSFGACGIACSGSPSRRRVASAGQIPHTAGNRQGREPMDVRLDGRTAIITGASKGLGLAMAREFAASGANVAMLARTKDTLDEAVAAANDGASGQAAGFACDVGSAEQIKSTFEAVMQRFGKVDILIN